MNASVPGGRSSDDTSKNHFRLRVPPAPWVAELFATLAGPLVAYTRRCLGGDIEVAREVVQEAFAKLCVQPWPAIESQAAPWLYKTCRHHAIDITRRKERIAMIPLGTEISSVHDRSCQVAQQKIEQSEELAAMRLQIAQLSEQQQEVLRLRLKDGLSYQQIAEVTGLTASNVGYHLHQAISTLRGKLQARDDDD